MKERIKNQTDKVRNFLTPGWVIPGLLIVFGLVLFGMSISGQSAYESVRAELLSEQQRLESELAELMLVKEPEVKQVEAKVYSASTIGNRVAKLQNDYRQAILNQAKEPKIHDDIQAELKTYFPDVVDGHMPWLMGGSDKPYEWVFTTNHEVASTEIPTLFLAYENKDDPLTLIAYVKANFNGATDVFTSRDVVMTTYGVNYFTGNDTGPGGNQNLHGKPTPAGPQESMPEGGN